MIPRINPFPEKLTEFFIETMSPNPLEHLVDPPGEPIVDADQTLWGSLPLPGPVPDDYVWFTRRYGQGYFDSQGSRVYVFPPTREAFQYSVEYLRNHLDAVADVPDINGVFTLIKAWSRETVGSSVRLENCIQWGSTDNDVNFFLIWLGEEVGWNVLVVDGGLTSTSVFLKTVTSFLYDLLIGHPLTVGFYPIVEGESMGETIFVPYRIPDL